MPSQPGFAVAIAPRCFHREHPLAPAACGELAEWQRNSGGAFPEGYYCDRHRSASDVPIAADLLIPRVQIVGEITIAGVDFAAARAKGEALDRVIATLATAGGVFSLLSLSARVARVPRQAAPGDAIGQGGAGLPRPVRH